MSQQIGIIIKTRADGSVEVKNLGGDFKKTGVEGERSAKKTTKAWDKVKAKSAGWSKSIKGLAGSWIGVTAAVGLAVKLAKDSFDAFQIQEKAEKDLAAALKITGEYTEKNINILKDFAAARQKVTTFGDEITLQNFALLASFKMNTGQMKRATIAAQDLSVGMGMDLKAATLLVGKAFLGETSTLSRYGIILDEGLTKTQKYAAAMEQLQQRFGGRATAEIDSHAGRMKQLANTWGDFTEVLGKFTPVVVLALEGLIGVVTVITNLGTGIGEVATKIGNFFTATDEGASGVKDNVDAIADKITKVAESSEQSAEKIKKAFEQLDLIPKTSLEEQAQKEIEAFKTIMKSGVISSNEDRIKAQESLFAKLEKLSKEAGPKLVGAVSNAMGTGPLEKRFDKITGTLTMSYRQLGDQLVAENEDIGKRMADALIKAPDEVFKRTGSTTEIILKGVTTTIDAFIENTIKLADEKFPILSDLLQDQLTALTETELKITAVTMEENRKRIIDYETTYGIILKGTYDWRDNMIKAQTGIFEASRNASRESSISTPSRDDSPLSFPPGTGLGAIKTFTNYETGINFVPRDMPAFLHKGERVVTADDNRNYDQRSTVNNFHFGESPNNLFDAEDMMSQALRKAQERVF